MRILSEKEEFIMLVQDNFKELLKTLDIMEANEFFHLSINLDSLVLVERNIIVLSENRRTCNLSNCHDILDNMRFESLSGLCFAFFCLAYN